MLFNICKFSIGSGGQEHRNSDSEHMAVTTEKPSRLLVCGMVHLQAVTGTVYILSVESPRS